MFNLFEIMRQAQGRAALEAMAGQFGLTPQQARQAADALLPAFTLGLQRNAVHHPQAFADLLTAMTSGRYAGFFEQPSQAFTPQGRSQGDAVLDMLFGTSGLTRQVAAQAAAASGVSAAVLQQVLPPFAATLMGGLTRTAQTTGASVPLAQIAEFFRQASLAAQPPQAPATPPGAAAGAAWADLFNAFMPPAPATSPPGPAPAAAHPFEAFFPRWPEARPPEPPAPAGPPPGSFENLVSSVFGVPAAEPSRPASPPPPSPAAPAPTAPADGSPGPAPGGEGPDPFALLGQMFQTGQEVQAQHLAALQTLFDQAPSAQADRTDPKGG